MKHSIFFLFTMLTLLTFQGCGGGGGDEASTVLSTSTSTTTSDRSTVILLPPVDTSKALETGEEVSTIVHAQMASPMVSVKSDIWPYDLHKASMWSTNVQIQTGVNEFYVSPIGKSTNLGTKDSPWDLATALWGGASKIVPANSIIWLMEGDYINPNSTSAEIKEFMVWLEGEPNRPIHVRPEYGARVRIDGGLYMTQSNKHLRVWDIEMTTIGEDWRPKPSYYIPGDTTSNSYALLYSWTGEQGKPVRDNINVLGGEDIKIINTVMDKTFEGIGFWKGVIDGELYGTIMYDNGWIDDDRPHGPGIYMQNSSGTTRIIHDNIIAGHLSTGMQIRSGSDVTNDFDIQGNVWFAPNSLADGRNYLHVAEYPSANINFSNNFVHAMEVKMPYVYTNTEYQGKKADHTCQNNHFYRTYTDGAYTCNDDIGNEDIKDVNDVANTITKAFIRPNKYDPRRANLIILNGKRLSDLSVDLGDFVQAGEKVIIVNSLDPFGIPIASGIYNGSYFNIHWPTASWNIEPQAYAKDLTTLNREFWAFVIMKVD